MTRRLAVLLAAIVATAAMCGDGGDRAGVAMVPASFTSITAEVDRAFAADGDDPVEWIIAGSSRLVRQLEDGADADLLVTADAETMQRALDDGLVDVSLGVVAQNRLVFALAPGNPGGIASLDDLAAPALLLGVCAGEVPCGRLAAEATTSLGIDVAADTEEPNVRALALKISRGELDAGLIYATDAIEFGLETAGDEELAPFLTDYVAASVRGATTGVTAFLRSDAGRAILEERGFIVP